ncbi:MAG: hypothetical protein J5796_05360, partial [Erysipelotrichaceae bacterium]|nr:hypothetical protein [Erysipelotrichaceae bacterium]
AIFFCLSGIKYDGHNYIDEAINNGAKVIVYSKEIADKDRAIFIKVQNVNNTLNKIANKFYYYPNEKVDTYVVSGNYGKSSVATFINYYLNSVSSCAYIGILGINYSDSRLKSSFSTLNILENIRLLDNIRNKGIGSCTFEASVRQLNLQKLDCIDPNFFIYTCTNRTSSDFYSDDYYIQLRKYLYTLEDDCRVILNIDDESYGQVSDCVAGHVTYGFNSEATYRIKDLGISQNGSRFRIVYEGQTYEFITNLQGISSVYNLAAAIAALNQKGHDMKDLAEKFRHAEQVDGVMERVDDEYDIIIDSAYDVYSIEQICKYANLVKQRNKAIGVISINYSDGDSRLQKIVETCEKYLDVIILTENESLEGEVMNILDRCSRFSRTNKVVHCPMRSIAIENAIDLLNRNDVLLIIGKGNEMFLEMGLGKEYYHGDRYYARKFIDKRRREENEAC